MDADTYIDSALEAMGVPVAKRQGIIHVGAETGDESLKKCQGIIHVKVAETDDESLKKRQELSMLMPQTSPEESLVAKNACKSSPKDSMRE